MRRLPDIAIMCILAAYAMGILAWMLLMLVLIIRAKGMA
jgi:hypothetical protein